jgi:HEAT repeat protein
MAGASLVLVAAWYSLSQDYVPSLCEIVVSERLADWHEQAIELLGELQSPISVPALVKSLDYRWDYDEWLLVPRKALRSLQAIGTPEAWAAVERARHSGSPQIRQEAVEILGTQSL